jgi:hypothetical protein
MLIIEKAPKSAPKTFWLLVDFAGQYRREVILFVELAPGLFNPPQKLKRATPFGVALFNFVWWRWRQSKYRVKYLINMENIFLIY